MKICIVSSCGGHLTEVRCLMPAYEQYEHFYVLNNHAELPPDMVGKTNFIVHSERDWKLIINLWEAFRILWRERPQVIVSTGSGPAVAFAIAGRYLVGWRSLHVEARTRLWAPLSTG